MELHCRDQYLQWAHSEVAIVSRMKRIALTIQSPFS